MTTLFCNMSFQSSPYVMYAYPSIQERGNLVGQQRDQWRSESHQQQNVCVCVCVYILYYIYIYMYVYVYMLCIAMRKKIALPAVVFFPSSCPESKDVDDGKSENRGQPATHHLCMARLLSGWTSSVSPSLLPYTKQPLLQSSAGSIYTG